MLELQKIFLIVRFFNRTSCNKGVKAKISRFLRGFSIWPPWGWNVLESEKLLCSWHHIGWRKHSETHSQKHIQISNLSAKNQRKELRKSYSPKSYRKMWNVNKKIHQSSLGFGVKTPEVKGVPQYFAQIFTSYQLSFWI